MAYKYLVHSKVVNAYRNERGNMYMKSLKKMLNDKRGVFGLTSVQQFFAIILGIALLAYVIVVIMGTLLGTSILPQTGQTSGAANQTQFILNNVSSGITSFFTNITPVYAILAILVIILVLVVLVRVVSGSTGGGAGPQL